MTENGRRKQERVGRKNRRQGNRRCIILIPSYSTSIPTQKAFAYRNAFVNRSLGSIPKINLTVWDKKTRHVVEYFIVNSIEEIEY